MTTTYGGNDPTNSNYFGVPYALDTSNSTYQKPSLFSSAASSSSSSGAWNPSDYLAAAQLIYGASQNKQAQNRASKPPKFIEAPQTDQEKKLWDLFYAQQTNPATANNRALVSGYAQDMLANSHPEWTPPKTSTGETGYNGTAGMKWPSMPSFDWSSYTKNSGAANTPTSAPGGAIPNNGGGGVFGSDNAKGLGPLNKSFVSDESNGGGGGGDQSIYDYLSSNPGGDVAGKLANPGGAVAHLPSQITADDLRPAAPDEFAALDSYFAQHPNEVRGGTNGLVERIKSYVSGLDAASVAKLIRDHPNEIATGIGMSTGNPVLPIVYKLLTKVFFPPTPPTPPSVPPAPPGKP